MLKSIGMTGKSYIVNSLLKDHPDWIHLHQSNREYFKLHPEVRPDEVNEIDLYNFFSGRLFSEKIKDTTYITERTPIDYVIFVMYKQYFKVDPNSLIFPDGLGYLDKCREDELRFLRQFDQVDIYATKNLDIKWMYEYFHSISKDDVHKIFYKSRGHFILYQDNWFKAFKMQMDLYQDERISYHESEFWKFPEDNQRFIESLQDKYGYNLFQ